MPHILLLEPYYGGSHKNFLTGLQKYVDCRFSLLTLPARKWKMRMQLAAPWFAEKIITQISANADYDAILCSTFLDVAVLRSLLSRQGITLPLAVYFHENQFCYPGQVADPGMYQFSAMNFTSALCADALAFNSRYNLESFLDGVTKYLKKATDMELVHLVKAIREKATVLYPGMDYESIDKAQSSDRSGNTAPIIVWNHRWEHDKAPETFFEGLIALPDNIDFQLIVLGEHFKRQPLIFARARELLADRLLHWGFAENREEYACLLKQGDIIVSTAVHEFFGISVLEGVRAGCLPLVPDRLSYQELFPSRYRYPSGRFNNHLLKLLSNSVSLSLSAAKSLTAPYDWQCLAPKYQHWLQQLAFMYNS